MNKLVIKDSLPPSSIILDENFGKPDYSDSYKIQITNCHSIDYLTAMFFASIPTWIIALLKLRDSIVKSFGLKTGIEALKIKPEKSVKYYEGQTAVFFHVLKRNENEIVLAEDDKHLNFRTSILIERNKEGVFVYSSTIVKYNNFWGRLYFFPVKPFHKIIIRTMLKILIQKLSEVK